MTLLLAPSYFSEFSSLLSRHKLLRTHTTHSSIGPSNRHRPDGAGRKGPDDDRPLLLDHAQWTQHHSLPGGGWTPLHDPPGQSKPGGPVQAGISGDFAQ